MIIATFILCTLLINTIIGVLNILGILNRKFIIKLPIREKYKNKEKNIYKYSSSDLSCGYIIEKYSLEHHTSGLSLLLILIPFGLFIDIYSYRYEWSDVIHTTLVDDGNIKYNPSTHILAEIYEKRLFENRQKEEISYKENKELENKINIVNEVFNKNIK